MGAVCADCGGDGYLSIREGVVRCYECAALVRGHRPTEDDHLAGRANWGGLTVRLRRNDHARVTELRLALGMDRWPAANGDPLLVLAHFLGGLATLLVVLAEYLTELAAHLARRLGPTWFMEAAPGPIVQ